MLQISDHIVIPDTEIELHAIRAQGAEQLLAGQPAEPGPDL